LSDIEILKRAVDLLDQRTASEQPSARLLGAPDTPRAGEENAEHLPAPSNPLPAQIAAPPQPAMEQPPESAVQLQPRRGCCGHSARRVSSQMLLWPLCRLKKRRTQVWTSAMAWVLIPYVYMTLVYFIVIQCGIPAENLKWEELVAPILYTFINRCFLLIGVPLTFLVMLSGYVMKRAILYVAMLIEVMLVWSGASRFSQVADCNSMEYGLCAAMFGLGSAAAWLFMFLNCMEPLNTQVEILAAFSSLRVKRARECQTDNCPICLARFAPDETVRVAPCNHAFHEECAWTWIKVSRTCALCRRPVGASEDTECCVSAREWWFKLCCGYSCCGGSCYSMFFGNGQVSPIGDSFQPVAPRVAPNQVGAAMQGPQPLMLSVD